MAWRTGHEPVHVTGIGAIVAGACGVEEFWRQLRDGRSQLGFLTRCDPAGTRVRVAGEIRGFDPAAHLPDLPTAHAAKYSRDILYVMAAVRQALSDAGLDAGAADPRRVSLVGSCSRGPVSWVDAAANADADVFADKGAMLCGIPGSAVTMAAIDSGIQGGVTTLSNACVGGNHAIGVALDTLRAGRADVVLVVGYEFPLVPFVLRSFASMGTGVLAAERDTPARAMKPYTRQRDGLVLGEGAVVLCLERASFARRRNARVYAEVLTHAALSEAANPFSMDLTGARTASVVGEALDEVGAKPADVQYYCGHGTATRHNDLAESRALGLLYDDRLRSQWPPLSSNKPIYGHLLGAAGVLNAAATALMIHHGTVTPTINYADPDPECDHDHVGAGARPVAIDLAVSMTFAIGSQTSVVVLGAAP